MMEEELKEKILAEVIKLEKSKDGQKDDSEDEETWGNVEDIWGTAIRIVNFEHNSDKVNIVAGESLTLDFNFKSEPNLPLDYLENLKKEISEKTNYSSKNIKINLKAK